MALQVSLSKFAFPPRSQFGDASELRRVNSCVSFALSADRARRSRRGVDLPKVSPCCELSNSAEGACDSGSGIRFRVSELGRRLVGGASAASLLSCSALVTAPAAVSVQALSTSDFTAAAFTLAGALSTLHVFDELAKRNFLEEALAMSRLPEDVQKLSRKLCHISSGMVFMLFWPLFSAAPLAKYLAAFAPAANGVRMIGLGLGLWKNEALVKAISREGSRSELLQGPLYYAITITVATVFFWRNSPLGAWAVATLCAGDGFADIVGRRWGKRKVPYNSKKSIIGSAAFFIMASLGCMGYLAYFSAFGYFVTTPRMYLASVGVAFISAVVESLPIPVDDNISVPFSAIGAGMLLLPA